MNFDYQLLRLIYIAAQRNHSLSKYALHMDYMLDNVSRLEDTEINTQSLSPRTGSLRRDTLRNIFSTK